MTCAKDEALRKPLGVIPLSAATVNTNVKDPVDNKLFLFEVSTVVQKSWIIGAKTEEERNSWVQSIKYDNW